MKRRYFVSLLTIQDIPRGGNLLLYPMHRVGFEPTQLTLPDLKSGSLDHSDIDALEINDIQSILSPLTNTLKIMRHQIQIMPSHLRWYYPTTK